MGVSWSVLGRSWLQKLFFQKSLKNIRKNNDSGTSWEARIALGLPFPLPPALDHSARRILQTPFSTPYRTLTSLNFTPLNFTQLTSLFDLLGLHFGPSWLPQIDPRSVQDRSKSPLEALLFQKREFSRNIGRRSVWGLSRVPKTTQDRPKTAPRRSSRSAFSDLVFIFDFGPS